MYEIEKKYINTNSMTPARAQAYYGRSRTVTSFITHWWGLPENRAKSPDNIYSYMKRANKSVNFILGWDDKQAKIRIIAMTPLTRVALTTQSANPFSISVETDPLITTSDPRSYELYKALGWLTEEMDKHFGRTLKIELHNKYFATQCSPIDTARVRREADKWAIGTYGSVDTVLEGPEMVYERFLVTSVWSPKKDGVKLWDFNHKKHTDMTNKDGVTFDKDDQITIVGVATHPSGSRYGMTSWSFGAAEVTGQPKATTGINMADLELFVEATPTPPTDPEEVEETPVVLPPSVDTTPDYGDQIEEIHSIVTKIWNAIKSIFNIGDSNA